jgi:putative ABC transport system substrate-binding protein
MLLWRGPTEVEQGVRDYLEGKGLTFNFTCLSADQRASRIPEMVARARALDPDLVYT